jgi:hypothetical protein
VTHGSLIVLQRAEGGALSIRVILVRAKSVELDAQADALACGQDAPMKIAFWPFALADAWATSVVSCL